MSHALESLTARAFSRRAQSGEACSARCPQGANPFSTCSPSQSLQARRRVPRARGGAIASDTEARTEMMYAGDAVRHRVQRRGLPPAARPVVRGVGARRSNWHVPGYPEGKTLVPHGMAVVLSNPSVWRHTAPRAVRRGTCTARRCLGATTRDAGPDARRRGSLAGGSST